MIGILFFGICFVSSEEPPDYDYGDPNSYNNPDFIKNSNPSNWDPNKVDFNNLEFQNRMNFDENARAWYQDNFCGGVCTITPQDQQLTYSRNEIRHSNGKSVVSIGYYPPGTVFVATQHGIEVRLPEGAVSVNVLRTDFAILRVSDNSKVVIRSANCGGFVNCNVIKGLNGGGGVVVKNGGIIQVLENTDVIVDGIQHKTSKNTLNLYYGGVSESFLEEMRYFEENYFVYDKDKILLGGDGFTSNLRNGNTIFPEYTKNKYQHSSSTKRKARLEFKLNGGNLEITKISQDNHPLALDIKSSGKSKIANGNWIFESDGNNVNAKLEDWHNFPLSSDIKLDYQDSNGISSTYKLDVNSKYKSPLTEGEKIALETKIYELENLRRSNKGKIRKLKNNPSVEQTSNEVKKIDEQIKNNDDEYADLERQLKGAKQAGISEQVKEIEEKKAVKDEEYGKLKNARNNLIDSNPDYKRLEELSQNNNILEMEIKEFEKTKEEWKKRTGVWGSILTSENGGFKGTHSEFIEGFPVLKNTDIYEYYDESGGKIKSVVEKNMDKLELIVNSKYQTCADTQIELFSMYKLQEMEKGHVDSIKFKISNGEELQYNSDGTYTIWDETKKAIVLKNYQGGIGKGFDNWITNVQVFSNTGSLRASTDRIKINDLKPGDLITLYPDRKTGYGHTKAVKEVLEIPPRSGRIYYRLFAGSDPAIDARIYKNLVSKKEFSDMVGKKDIEFSRFR